MKNSYFIPAMFAMSVMVAACSTTQQAVSKAPVFFPALPDEPQCLAAVDVKRDAVDRVDLTGSPGEHAGMDREMLFQPIDLKKRAHAAPPSTCSACQQATQWPGRYCTSGG